MVRRSRGLLLFVSVLILHIIVLSIIKYDPYPRYNFFKSNMVDLKVALVGQVQPNNPISFINQLIHTKFTTYIQNNADDAKNKLFLLNLGRDDEFDEVKVERPGKWLFGIMPEETGSTESEILTKRYDPRFTFSLLLDNVRQQLQDDQSVIPTVPYFHWSDYTDTSKLEDFYINQKSCDMFDVTSSSASKNAMNDLVDPSMYCYTDEQIDELMKTSSDPQFTHNLELIKNSSSTGFHIYASGGRSTLYTREYQAKSYLKDFMPPPLSINFLLPDNQNLYVKVEQDIVKSKKQLYYTDVMQSYFSTHKTINTRKVLNEIQHELPVSSVATNLTYYKHLDPDQFIDSSKHYMQQMDNEKLDYIGQNYLDALKRSFTDLEPPKYFKEANLVKSEYNFNLGAHYDWRFFSGIINYTDLQVPALHGLVRAWLRLTNSNNLTTWIAHGSLLSWYWDGIAFPWDNDIDVQMPVDDLHRLSRKFNQSIVVDLGGESDGEMRYGRYFLDCGTYISQRGRGNGNNNIDARFIDMETGLYVDITGLALTDTITPLRYNHLLSEPLLRENLVSELERNIFLQAYNCRNYHFSTFKELSPLKLSMVEGEFTYVPNQFQQILDTEYSNKGTESIYFSGFTFVPRLRNWIRAQSITLYMLSHDTKIRKSSTFDKLVSEFDNDDFYIDFLFSDKDVLMEYLVTSDVTDLHEQEITMLLQGGNASSVFFDEHNNLKVKPAPLRHDYFTYNAFKRKYEYTLKLDDPPPDSNDNQKANFQPAAKVNG